MQKHLLEGYEDRLQKQRDAEHRRHRNEPFGAGGAIAQHQCRTQERRERNENQHAVDGGVTAESVFLQADSKGTGIKSPDNLGFGGDMNSSAFISVDVDDDLVAAQRVEALDPGRGRRLQLAPVPGGPVVVEDDLPVEVFEARHPVCDPIGGSARRR